MRIREGSVAYAPCTNGSTISAVLSPSFGNRTLNCNSTSSYS